MIQICHLSRFCPIFISIILIAVGTVSSLSADPLPPKIEILQPVFNFGTITEGTRVTHDFEVANVGGTELIIQQVVPACGCTAAVAKESTVAPGAKTVVHVEFDSTGFSGEKTKAARVNSNDPVSPSVFITLQGVIETELTLEPARIYFNEFVVAKDANLPSAKVSVRARGATEIASVVAGSASLEVQTVKSSPQEWELLARPAAGVAVGDLRDRLIVVINKNGQKREVSIPVLGKAVGVISLKPSSVAVGIIDGEAPIERRIQMESRGGRPFSIRAIESDNPAVTITKKPIDSGKALVLVVQVDPKQLVNDLRATVTIQFENDDLSPLQFSVYGVKPPKVE